MSSVGFTDSRPLQDLRRNREYTEPTRARDGRRDGEDVGAWSEDLDVAVYGEQEWLIPGMGEAGDRCGEWGPRDFCDVSAHVVMGKHSCGRRECPTCWSGQWAGPRTVNVVAKLAAARYAAEEGADKRGVHAVLSPAGGSIDSIEGFYQGRTDALDLAKQHGVRGGVVVAHGFRPTDDTKDAFEDADPEGGIWRYIRENRRDWREQVYWSPHYHVIGLGRFEDVTEGDPEADDGWLFKKIRTLDRFEGLRDRGGYNDMAGAVRYLLSHATFPAEESRQAVTWYGALHPVNFSPEEALSDGAWSVIQREAESVVGNEGDRSEEGEGPAVDDEEEREECPVDGCDGHLHPIWDADDFMEQRGDRLTDEEHDRLLTAYMWATGDIDPPPGLKHPKSEEHARESFNAMLTGV